MHKERSSFLVCMTTIISYTHTYTCMYMHDIFPSIKEADELDQENFWLKLELNFEPRLPVRYWFIKLPTEPKPSFFRAKPELTLSCSDHVSPLASGELLNNRSI